MLHAFTARKVQAHRILGDGKREPREDIITASLFGSADFLPDDQRKQLWEALLGTKLDGRLEVHLWPSFWIGLERVEPDVVVCEHQGEVSRFWIIEVKWGAAFGLNQVARTLRFAREGNFRSQGSNPFGDAPRSVPKYLLLGRRAVHLEELKRAEDKGEPVAGRSWVEVTRILQRLVAGTAESPLSRWIDKALGFLLSTSEGSSLQSWPPMAPLPQGRYEFSQAYHWTALPVGSGSFKFL